MDQKALVQIAKLARIHLSASEMQEFQLQLNEALEYFNKIKKFSIDKKLEGLVDPLDGYREITGTENILRQDKVENHYTSKDLMELAPARAQQEYLVPPAME